MVENQSPTVNFTRWGRACEAALIVLISLALLTQCWDADFINYDDTVHVLVIPQVYGEGSVLELFGVPTDTYMPLTYCSYRLDFLVLGKWLTEHTASRNWAPVVRGMNWVYHACASLVLWRIMLLLGIGRLPALFVALIFAVHPTACETVCWVSERKNTLAAMFGLASVWSFLALDGRVWRMPLTFLLYTLALCSKPTALGFLPLFGFIELFNGAAGLRGERSMLWKPGKPWLMISLRMAPLAALSLVVVWLNIHGKTDTIVPPPGGSVYTGILTDTEVLLRYIGIMLAPINLSIAYYVKPIVSLLDPRLIGYGLILAAAIGVTTYFARNRRLAAFGWIWFVVVLTPCLNIVCISYAMQDRYIYFTLPGFFLALTEFVLGLRARFAALPPRAVRTAAAAFVAMLMALSIVRSAAYQDAYLLFKDAAEKQPDSAFAHYGLANSYTAFIENIDLLKKTDGKSQEMRADFVKKVQEERRIFLTCKDAERQVFYTTIATDYGEHQYQQGHWDDAEHYMRLAAYPGRGIVSNRRQRAIALRDLAVLRLAQKNPADAYAFAQQALDLSDYADRSLLLRAKAALALAADESREGHADRAAELKAQARADLASVPESAEAYSAARKLLDELGQAEHAP